MPDLYVYFAVLFSLTALCTASKGCAKDDKYTGWTIDKENPVDCQWSEWCTREEDTLYFPASKYDTGEKACRQKLRKSELDCSSECARMLCIAQAGVYCGRDRNGRCGCTGLDEGPPQSRPKPKPKCDPPCKDDCEQCVQVQCFAPPCPPMCQRTKPNTGWTIDKKNPVDCKWSEWCTQQEDTLYFPASKYDTGEKACRQKLGKSELDCSSECARMLCIAQAGVYCGRANNGRCGCIGPDQKEPQSRPKPKPTCNPPCKDSCEQCVQVQCFAPPCPPTCQRSKPNTGWTIDRANPLRCEWSEWCTRQRTKLYFPATTYDTGEKACREKLSQLDCSGVCFRIRCAVRCGRRRNGSCGCIGRPNKIPNPKPKCDPPCTDSCEQCVQVQCFRAPCPPLCLRIPGCQRG